MTEQVNTALSFMTVFEDTQEQICALENLTALAGICISELAQKSPDQSIGQELRDGLIGLLQAITVKQDAIFAAHGREHEWHVANRPEASNEQEIAALIEAHHKAEAAFVEASDAPGAGSNETPAELAAYKHMQDTAEQVTRIRPTSPQGAASILQFFVHEYGESAFGDVAGDPDRQLIENVTAGLTVMRAA